MSILSLNNSCLTCMVFSEPNESEILSGDDKLSLVTLKCWTALRRKLHTPHPLFLPSNRSEFVVARFQLVRSKSRRQIEQAIDFKLGR